MIKNMMIKKKGFLNSHCIPEIAINEFMAEKSLRREDVINIIPVSLGVELWYWNNEIQMKNETGLVYRVYKEVNYADTCRDDDDIHITELGCKHELEEAKTIANDYIKKHFFNKNTELQNHGNGMFSATDFRSYGETVIIQPVPVD